jgi:hypothetical protein
MSRFGLNWLLLIVLLAATAASAPIWPYSQTWGLKTVSVMGFLLLLTALRLIARYFE